MSEITAFIHRELDDLKKSIKGISTQLTPLINLNQQVEDLKRNDREIFKRLNEIESKVTSNYVKSRIAEWIIRIIFGAAIGLIVYYIR